MPENEKRLILSARDIKTYFPMRRGLFQRVYGYKKAVDGVSFDVYAGETLGIVGESGCGKSTLGKTVLRLNEPTSGKFLYYDKDKKPVDFFCDVNKQELFEYRRKFQMIFQDPNLSLDPKMQAFKIVEEPLLVHSVFKSKSERADFVVALLEKVGINSDMINRYPHEFSGGQKQRIGIARALALNPEIIVADEPVSALDVSVQAQVLNLMQQLQRELGLTYIFISHNLSVINHISDRVMVLYMGRVVEFADCESFFKKQHHPYSELLKNSILHFDDEARLKFTAKAEITDKIHLEVPDYSIVPKNEVENSGNYCYFNPRCGYKTEICMKSRPELREVSKGRFVACHNHIK